MKTRMKNWMIALACLFTISTAAFADNDKPIAVNQLPAAAQQTIKKHFSTLKVAMAKVESGLLDKTYDVIFTNGEKIEFNRSGEWTEISCKATTVPAALIPSAIAAYINENYPNTKVLSIERDREYEVQLNNRIEQTFNKNFQLIDIDM